MLASFPGLETVWYGPRPPTQITYTRACNAKCVTVRSLSEREIISVVRLLVLLFITVLKIVTNSVFSDLSVVPNYTLEFCYWESQQ